MDKYYIQIALLCAATATLNAEAVKTVHSATTHRAIDEVIVMGVVPEGAQLDNLITDFMSKHPDKEILRLAMYQSEEDARDTEAPKLGEMNETVWQKAFVQQKKTAKRATEFVRIGRRAVIRVYDEGRPTVSGVPGFKPLTEIPCRGSSVQFLHLGFRQVGPEMKTRMDAFFLYGDRFSVRDAAFLADDLSVEQLGIANVYIAGEPAFAIGEDYPFFNRFIDPSLYLPVEELRTSTKPTYFCTAREHIKLWCGQMKVLGEGR